MYFFTMSAAVDDNVPLICFKWKRDWDAKKFDAWDDDDWNLCTRCLYEMKEKGLVNYPIVNGMVYFEMKDAESASKASGKPLEYAVFDDARGDWVFIGAMPRVPLAVTSVSRPLT